MCQLPRVAPVIWLGLALAACGGSETPLADGGSDIDGDADADADSDADTDSDADAECAADGTLALSVGQGALADVDVAAVADRITLGCEELPGGADWILGLSVEAGDLAVTLRSDDHIGALYRAAGLAGDECPATSDEIGCADPYYSGANLLFRDLEAGDYLLVVSEWAPGEAGALGVPVVLYADGSEICDNGTSDDGDGDIDCDDADCGGLGFCDEEACDNGADDDWDGATDCLEPACVGTSECTGADCQADTDLGVIGMNGGHPVGFDTTTDGADRFRMPCTPVADTPEYVVAFTTNVAARVQIDLTQEAQGDHSLGFFFEGGPGATCIDYPAECYGGGLVRHLDGAFLAGGDTLQPGRYFVVVEVNGAAGAVDLTITATPVCEEGYVWDHIGLACEEWPCPATDLGTWAGVAVSEGADTCAGTALFGNDDASCTGWGASSEEIVYRIEVPDGETIDVTLAPDDGSAMDASLYLLEDCGDFDRSTCAAGADTNPEGGEEAVSYTNSSGADRTLFVFADAYSGCGGVTLTVE
jgi:hypothetical protein